MIFKIYAHSPIANSQKKFVLWEDVWIRWKIKPGRKNYKIIAPCLISYADCLNLSAHEFDEELKIALEFLKRKEIYIGNCENEMPNIYSPEYLINRKEANKMITKLLQEKYDFKNIELKWKRTKIEIVPV